MTLSSLEPGTILAKRYEIRRVLGSGGMGVVFQAHDRDLDEPVALKVLRPETLSMDPSILERFKTEIRVARRIATSSALSISGKQTASSSSAWSSCRA